MLRDKGPHASRQPIALRQLHATAHMLADDARAALRLQLVVRVVAAELVLDVVAGLEHFADVVVVAAYAYQQGVRAHEVGRALRQVPHDDAVVERARRFVLQPAEQRRVQLRELHQLYARRHAEQRSDDGEASRREETAPQAVHRRGRRHPDDVDGAAFRFQQPQSEQHGHDDGADQHTRPYVLVRPFRSMDSEHADDGPQAVHQQYSSRVQRLDVRRER